MNIMKRYQVVFYDHMIGVDEGMDYDSKAEAIEEARRYRRGVRDWCGDLVKWDGAAVYDDESKTATVVYGNPYNFRKAYRDYVTVLTLRGDEVTTPTYQQEKDAAREKAIAWQSWVSDRGDLSYGEIAAWQDYFERLGRRYGLLREFRENAIC